MQTKNIIRLGILSIVFLVSAFSQAHLLKGNGEFSAKYLEQKGLL